MNRKHFTTAEREARLESEEAYRLGRDQLIALEQLSDRAKEEFERLKAQAYWLDNLDRNELILLSFYWDKALAIIEEYDSAPEVLELKGGDGSTKLVSNPLRKALRDYGAEMRSISSKLGLTSIDRLKLVAPSAKKENKFMKLIK